jgi:Holliday junction resolvase-like predicted endonuclease
MPKTMHMRVLEAAQRFFDRKGFKIIDLGVSENIDLVAMDNETLRFIQVRGYEEKELPIREIDDKQRQKIENQVIAFLDKIDKDYLGEIFFDYFDLIVLHNEKAFVRYHMNALKLNSR